MDNYNIKLIAWDKRKTAFSKRVYNPAYNTPINIKESYHKMKGGLVCGNIKDYEEALDVARDVFKNEFIGCEKIIFMYNNDKEIAFSNGETFYANF